MIDRYDFLRSSNNYFGISRQPNNDALKIVTFRVKFLLFSCIFSAAKQEQTRTRNVEYSTSLALFSIKPTTMLDLSPPSSSMFAFQILQLQMRANSGLIYKGAPPDSTLLWVRNLVNVRTCLGGRVFLMEAGLLFI